MRKLLLLLALLAVLPSAASAADLYVSPSGSGSSCTLSSPCSLPTANSNAQAGDTVYMRGGTYATPIAPARSGTSDSSRITYQAYNGESVTINGVYNAIELSNRNYIEINSIRVTNAGHSWAYLMGADHNVIRDCVMTNAGGWAGIDLGGGADYNKILDNTLSAGASGPEDVINIMDSSYPNNYNLVQGNTIGNAMHQGINLNGKNQNSRYNIIRNNMIRNTWHTGMAVWWGPQYTLVENNIIYDSGIHDDQNHRTDEHDVGLQVASEYSIYRNNVFAGTRPTTSPGVGHSHTRWEADNKVNDYNRIYSNVYYDNQIALSCQADNNFGFVDNIFKNNIFYLNDQQFQVCDGRVTFISNSDNSVNPRFVNAPSRDFNLQSNSPMIDAGTWLTTITSSSGSGTSFKVVDSRYFMDGYGIIQGDLIQLQGQTQAARITSVNYGTNTITVEPPLSWTAGQGVSLAYSGSKPDIGAFEYGSVPSTQTCSDLGGADCCAGSETCPGTSYPGSSDCAGTCCSQQCTLPQAKSYTVLKTNDPPSIDGDLDEFANANAITVTNSVGNSATYRFLWDDTALYIAAQGSDDQLAAVVTARDGDGRWNDDSIELFFDTLNDAGDSMNPDDYKFFVSLLNVQHDYSNGGGAWSWDTTFSSAVTTDGTLNKSGDTDTGYTIEMAIPWADWVTPAAGSVWGFDVAMEDRRDDGTRIWEAWSQEGSLNIPNGYGDIVFSGEAIDPISDSYTALRAPSPPSIDGDLDEFANANAITVTNSVGNSATYRFLWDDTALYIAAQGSDDQLAAVVTARDGDGRWNDDSIELFFDTLNDAGDSMNPDDYKFFVSLLNVQHDYSNGGGAWSWDTTFSSAVTTDGTLNKSGDTDTGYTIEMAIPWADWVTPAAGSVWGFDVAMEDRRDDGTRIWEAWSQEGSLNIPNGYGDIVFSAETPPNRHRADTSGDGCIDSGELGSFIGRFYLDSTAYPMGELMEAVGLWKSGAGC